MHCTPSRVTGAAIAAALTLGACSSGPETTTPEPTTTQHASPTPEADPTPASESDWPTVDAYIDEVGADAQSMGKLIRMLGDDILGPYADGEWTKDEAVTLIDTYLDTAATYDDFYSDATAPASAQALHDIWNRMLDRATAAGRAARVCIRDDDASECDHASRLMGQIESLSQRAVREIGVIS